MAKRQQESIFWKLLLVCFFSVSLIPLFGQSLDKSITIWILNNETKFMGILATDRYLMDKMSLPFAMIGTEGSTSPRPENSIWAKHLSFFTVLDNLSNLYSTIQVVQKQKLGKILKNVFPGYVATKALIGQPVFVAQKLGPVFERQFREAFLKILGIEKTEDANLFERAENYVKVLGDKDRRLLLDYLETFSALYSKDSASKILFAIIKDGVKKDFSNNFLASVKNFVKVGKAESTGQAGQELDDAAFFDSLNIGKGVVATDAPTGIPEESTPAASATKDAAPPVGDDDIFDILN